MGKHHVTGMTLLALWMMASGCTMAPDLDLDDYGAYGGRWQRTLRNSGRVGSVFSPAGAQVSYDDAPSSSSMISPEGEPSAAPETGDSTEPGNNQEDMPPLDESVLDSAPVALRPPASVIH